MQSTRGHRFRMTFLSVGLAALAAGGCAERQARKAFIEPVEAAHGRAAWNAQTALAFEIDIQDGLDVPARARLTCAVHSPEVRAEFNDGTRVVWDGLAAWVSPEAADPALACRRVRAWSWLLTAPVRIRDLGVKVNALGDLPHGDEVYPSARLTFKNGQPLAPSPGYILYADPHTHHVVAIAYVSGGDSGAPEWVARAVTFDKFETVDGVVLPTEWKLWPWSRGDGPCGDLIGHATVSKLRFVEVDPTTFAIPDQPLPPVVETPTAP